MVPIPADILLHVSHFIPPDDLRDMLEVNRMFFQLAMAERYRVITFPNDIYTKKMDEIHGLRDSVRARCVRKLVLSMDFRQITVSDIPPPTREIVQTMIDTVPFFTNVTEFGITRVAPSLPPSDEELLPFFTAAWKAFGSTLQTLDLHVSLTHLPTLLPTANNLVALSALAVVLTPGNKSYGHNGSEFMCEVLTTFLAPFINKVSPTLRRWKLRARTFDLNLLPLFQNLGGIPNLEQFDFPLHCAAQVFSDPHGITRFFHDHTATLRHLFLFDDQHWDNVVIDTAPTQQYVTDWLSAHTGDPTLLSNLLTLHWTLAWSGGQFDMLVPYLRRSAHTLTSLRLYGAYMCDSDVQTLMSLFDPRSQTCHLKDLRLTVVYITPELIILLARTFPRLKSLVVDAFSATTSNEGGGITASQDVQKDFAARVRMCDISDWPLHTIEIRMSGNKFHWEIARRLMWVLADCVPSVKMFGNVSKEDPSMASDYYL